MPEFNTVLPLGRSWSVQELRDKSSQDIHCLWWKCVKERNRISTSIRERNRLKLGFGDYESQKRDETVGAFPGKHQIHGAKGLLTDSSLPSRSEKLKALSESFFAKGGMHGKMLGSSIMLDMHSIRARLNPEHRSPHREQRTTKREARKAQV